MENRPCYEELHGEVGVLSAMRAVRRRNGFTLIELIVAMALLVILLLATFGAVSAFYRMSAAQQQEILLQQNFRFAIDTMSTDARQAILISSPATTHQGMSMDEGVLMQLPDGWYRYEVQESGSGSSRVAELVKQPVDSTSHVANGSPQKLTEPLPLLLKSYFVYSGTKLYMMLVGRMQYMGKMHVISLVSLVYARNLGG